LLAFLGLLSVALAPLPADAAGAAEQDGPPMSAAPRPKPAPPPYTPSQRAPAGTTAPPKSAAADEAMYERCMKLTTTDPGAARDLAEHWQGRGGAHPADHCYAVALVGLKQFKEGAARLEALAKAMDHAPDSLRAEVLDQAAQAWLLGGDAARAYAADSAALNILPNDPDILVDRAEAAGSEGWYDKAVGDLDRVLKADPNRVDALVYRASANRELGKLEIALIDADKAVALAPNSVEALLERGDILRLKGDLDGARRDWVRVSELAPGSTAASDARTNIERLELKEDAAAPTGGKP
ncbi:MAG TPA: tetratricopeptide repeat protein, partial [Stellaceae bacterium]|nr:tetratricopeptide repeat protein [Stellaceae bacterium]